MAFPTYFNLNQLEQLQTESANASTKTPKLRTKEFFEGESKTRQTNSFTIKKDTPVKSAVSSIDFDLASEMSFPDIDFYHSEYGLRRFFLKNPIHFEQRVTKGPPKLFRWLSWIILSRLPALREKKEYIKMLEVEINEEYSIQIEKDITRTLSEGYEFFKDEKAQHSLFRLLKAIVAIDPELSYCQGMNFIAGFLLALCDFEEVDSFFLFSSILSTTYRKEYNVRGFFLAGFPSLKAYLYAFDHIFQLQLPKMRKHFKDMDLPDETWISKWFQTLFTICLSPSLCSRVWDCFFAQGKLFLLKFAIALLKSLQKNLMEFEDVVDLTDFLKRMNPYVLKKEEVPVELNDEAIIKQALSEQITYSEVQSLLDQFEQKEGVRLTKYELKYDLPKNNTEVALTTDEEFVAFNRNDYKRSSQLSEEKSDNEISKSAKKSCFAKVLDQFQPGKGKAGVNLDERYLNSENQSQHSNNLKSEELIKKALHFNEVDSEEFFEPAEEKEGIDEVAKKMKK